MDQTDKVLKILVVGNSHGLDATTLLYEVFKKEAPEQKVIVGALYDSGCSIGRHAGYIRDDVAGYIYYKNGDFPGANQDGSWLSTYNEKTKEGFKTTVKYALEDEKWDLVVMQQMNRQSGVDREDLSRLPEEDRNFFFGFNAEDYQTVINHIFEKVHPAPQLAWHMAWANPDRPEYLGGEGSNPELSLNVGWGVDHGRLYPDSNGNFNTRVMYEKIVANAQKYIVDSTDFLGSKYYSLVLPSATAVQYALDVQGLSQWQVFRDYTHVSDYTRLMVSYVWYAKIMQWLTGENITVDAIRVTQIPKALHTARLSTYPPANPEGNYSLTEEMRAKILEAVQWTLAHPYHLPK